MKELEFQSTGGLLPHTHTLRVPMNSVENPSAFLILNTSTEWALLYRHFHTVTISAEQMKKIKAGETVVVNDNETKRHSFALRL